MAITRNDMVALLKGFESSSWQEVHVDETSQAHRWLPVLKYRTTSGVHAYGLLDTGAWHKGYRDKKRVRLEGHPWGFFVLLELPFRQLIEVLRQSISDVGLPNVVLVTFPLDWIVEQALATKSDWNGLAQQWLEDGYPPNDAIASFVPEHRMVARWRNRRLEEIFGPVQPKRS